MKQKSFQNYFIVVPPSQDPSLDIQPASPAYYEGDIVRVTCLVNGGLPLASLTWDCPGLGTTVSSSNSTSAWTLVTGTITRTLNGRTCRCTARHQAWLPLGSNTRDGNTAIFNVYCKSAFASSTYVYT